MSRARDGRGGALANTRFATSRFATSRFAAALLVMMLPAISFRAAVAAEAPSPERQARLRDAMREAKAIRVVTRAGPFIEKTVELSDAGVRLPGSPQLGETIVTPPQPALVPWELLSSIEMRGAASDRGLLVGAALGAAFGALYAFAPHSEQTLGGRSGGLLYVVAGAAGGAAFGSLMGTGADSWKRVWPDTTAH
jgi:hypothetical protein